MDAEDLLGHNGRDWETVEHISKGFPNLDITTTLAFIVEAIDAGDIGAFMVAAEDKEILGVLELEAQ